MSSYRDTEYASTMAKFKQEFIAQGRKGLAPERIGEVVLEALTAKKPRVRYAIVPQRFANWTLPNLLPRRMVDRLIGKQLGFPSR